MVKAKGCRVCLFAFVAMAAAGCATRHDFIDVDARVASIEKDRAVQVGMQEEIRDRMEKIEGRVEGQEQDLRSSFARMRSEVDSLRLMIQELQGSMEESFFRTQGVTEKRDALAGELAYLKDSLMKLSGRIEHMADYVGFESSAVEIPDDEMKAADVQQRTKAEVHENVDTLYAEAKQAFDNGVFEKARDGFQEILKRFPDAGLADNAQFWIGEIYYRENWYEKAILEYQKVIDNYPKGNKVASSLLKQGLAFEKLGQKANARLILEELLRKYPGSSESLIAQRKLRQL
ncbi:tol-pal system protein YbgF [Desulfobotulus sp. H1]|uniref:Tol-pal system protein YbgF n=1 Tax=Desulfobotulus pelophilus TaxID=2823377 RepID=A0ABT3N5L7_9BACT|nr:tol-pal system protein YbgF [Desulfobotulus pelophilus]MCW7752750.1 tol-pal system protein YbgF [Desulfobotulus pelophilus]